MMLRTGPNSWAEDRSWVQHLYEVMQGTERPERKAQRILEKMGADQARAAASEAYWSSTSPFVEILSTGR